MSSSDKRYLKHFGGAMLGYTGALFLSGWAIDSLGIAGWLAGALSLLPMIPVCYALHTAVVRVRAMDEVQRRIVLESMIWGAGIVAFVSFGYGFLEGSIDAPTISMIWVMPALIGAYGIASVVLPLRFK